MPSQSAAPTRRRGSGRRTHVDEARVQIPAPRPGSVTRTALVNRLRASSTRRVVSVLAPAGYGKSTLLAQWAVRDERPFAWVSLAECDRNPLVLSAHIEAALGTIDCLGSRGRSPRALAASLFALNEPIVLVLDGVELLRAKAAADLVAVLVERVPPGSTVVLAGRALPAGPLARLRAGGDLFELGTDDLALVPREVDLLLRGVGVELDEGELTGLAQRTEGWPVGVYLAGLAVKDRRLSATVAGDDRFVADYFDFELFSALRADDIEFLTRTAILDTMCGSLCDAVLEAGGSARRLQSFERAGLFLVPLDRSRTRYRYHGEFRDFLRTELERREPRLVPDLNRRAATWCEGEGDVGAAIGYARAAGETEHLARLLGGQAVDAWLEGPADEVERWLAWFDTAEALERYPAIAALGARAHAIRGRTAAAERWLSVAESSPFEQALADGTPSIASWVAVVRAAMCPDGAEKMAADAEAALAELAPMSPWRPTALVARGAAHILQREAERADLVLAEAAEAAEDQGAVPSLVAALAQRSLLALAHGDAARSSRLAVEARSLVGEHRLAGDVRCALALAASAWHELRAGSLERARADLERAEALRSQLTAALPWHSVQVALELGRLCLALLDVPRAREWLEHAGELFRRRPALGVLAARRDELEAEIELVARTQEERASTLSPAELRLLPLLATHRSFREIGACLHVSRNTVKTQAISIYRKLGVSGRGEAIDRAVELGLVGRD
jgi:LuxR family transcriptional regulator, maltose regulon positive regulatory protein